MRPTRIAAILMLAFLFGGSSAEVAVQTKRAFDRHRAAREEGSAGELVALEITRADGAVVARPRLVAAPGRAAHLVLADPDRPGQVRLELRIEAARQPDGDVSLVYELALPREELACSGRVSVTPGVEHRIELAEGAFLATALAVPVPSAAFDAYLAAERAARATADPT